MSKKVLIIGGGIAGLAAGCYARMNGFDALIFESHSKPGGVVTSWKRNDYRFDYAMHNLAGTDTGSDVFTIWNELGAFKNTSFIGQEEFIRIIDSSGKSLRMYTDFNRLKNHLMELAPEDKDVINEYAGLIRKMSDIDIYAMNLGGFGRTIKMLPKVGMIKKLAETSIEKFADKFSNPFLRRTFRHVQYDMADEGVPMLAHTAFMSGFPKGDLQWPVGGGGTFSMNIAGRFKELGGEIRYRTPIGKIIVENDTAVGVETARGERVTGDYVISACDGHATVYKFLDGKYTSGFIDSFYRRYDKTQRFGLQLFLGSAGEWTEACHMTSLLLDRPVRIGNIEHTSLFLEISGGETALCPFGKSVVKVIMIGDYTFWKDMKEADNGSYKAEKEHVYGTVINLLESYLPNIKNNVEVYDVTTPVTLERFTGSFHGWQPWLPADIAGKITMKGLHPTLPGLKRFRATGHWAAGLIGISTAAIQSKKTIRAVCRELQL